MKAILVAALIGVASISSLSTKAQVSVNVNIGSRPYYVAPVRTQYVYVKPQRRYVVPYDRYYTAYNRPVEYRRQVVVVREHRRGPHHREFKRHGNFRKHHHGRH